MKRVHKPLDVRGKRLYEVAVSWPIVNGRTHTDVAIVAADSPGDAANVIAEQYKEMPADRRPNTFGRALNVNMPQDWWDGPPSALEKCEHAWSCIQDFRGMGRWQSVFICDRCGEIEVRARDEKGHDIINFSIHAYHHLRAVIRGAKRIGLDVPNALKDSP